MGSRYQTLANVLNTAAPIKRSLGRLSGGDPPDARLRAITAALAQAETRTSDHLWAIAM
jgi:hypothetical protein